LVSWPLVLIYRDELLHCMTRRVVKWAKMNYKLIRIIKQTGRPALVALKQ
jgi:hypothetical protein